MRQLNSSYLAGLLIVLIAASPAFAYIGPGVGTGVIAVILGIIASLFLAIFTILYYPIKRYLRNRKSHGKAEHESTDR